MAHDELDSATLAATLSRSLATSIRAYRGELDGGEIYAAALTHSQYGALAFLLNTLHAEWPADLSDVDPAEADGYWWPDEWEHQPEAGSAGLEEVGEALQAYLWADGDDDPDPKRLARCEEVLEAGLGSAEVRAAFAELGCDPILMVCDADDDLPDAPAVLKRLNPQQRGPRFEHALAYWTAYAES